MDLQNFRKLMKRNFVLTLFKIMLVARIKYCTICSVRSLAEITLLTVVAFQENFFRPPQIGITVNG